MSNPTNPKSIEQVHEDVVQAAVETNRAIENADTRYAEVKSISTNLNTEQQELEKALVDIPQLENDLERVQQNWVARVQGPHNRRDHHMTEHAVREEICKKSKDLNDRKAQVQDIEAGRSTALFGLVDRNRRT